MIEHVEPAPGWMLVRECEYPFSKYSGPIELADQVYRNTNVQWHRIVAVGPLPPNCQTQYAKGDLVLVRDGSWDKVIADGGMVFGSVNVAHIQHRIPAEKAKAVKDTLRGVDQEAAEISAQSNMSQALVQRLAGGGVQPVRSMPKVRLNG